MKELYRVIVEDEVSRTTSGGFESAHEAACALTSMISELGLELEQASIEKYIE